MAIRGWYLCSETELKSKLNMGSYQMRLAMTKSEGLRVDSKFKEYEEMRHP